MTVSVPAQLEFISDGDGSTKSFSYPVRFLEKEEIVVAIRSSAGVDTVQTLNSDYTIAGTSWPSGGDVVFSIAPASGTKVVRYRQTQAKQVVDLGNKAKNNAESVEQQLDRLAMVDQDNKDGLASLFLRAAKFPLGYTGNTVLPSPDANAYLGWNASGDAIVSKTVINIEGFTAGTAGLAILADDTVDDVIFYLDLDNRFKRKLTVSRTYYVRTDGSDSNSGLVNNAGGAFATLSGAYAVISKLDFNGFDVTVQVANGTYVNGLVANVVIPGMKGARSLTFRGNVGSPSSVVISTGASDAVVAQSGGKVAVEGFRLQTSSAGARCMNANNGGEILFSDIEFGTCSGPHKETSMGGQITNYGNYSIVGSAQSHDHCTVGGNILTTNATVTLTGTPNFSAYFCGVNGACAVQYSSVVFSGSATGQKFVAHFNGSISAAGQDWNYLPGSTAGGCYGGGIYNDSSQRFNNGAFPSQPVASGGTVSAGFTDAALGANVFGLFSYANDSNAPIYYTSKSRGGAVGTHGIALNGDNVSERRISASNGTAFVNGFYERIAIEGTFTTGAAFVPMGIRWLISPDESTAPVERLRVDRLGSLYLPGMGTTASAANCFVNNASTPVANQLMRSTSSARYKRDIEDLDIEFSKKLLDARPVYYRSAVETDNQDYSHWGFIAEELAEIDPRLVHYGYKNEDWEIGEDGETCLREGAELVPDGVQYERMVVHEMALIKDLYGLIKELQSEISELKSGR